MMEHFVEDTDTGIEELFNWSCGEAILVVDMALGFVCFQLNEGHLPTTCPHLDRIKSCGMLS